MVIKFADEVISEFASTGLLQVEEKTVAIIRI